MAQTTPQPQTPTPPKPPGDRPHDETIKETIESIVIAFVLAFVFRAYVVEAFVIPTGSMAPTLLGAHLDIRCQQCGYRFAIDVPDSRGFSRYTTLPATCPMCRFPNPISAAHRVGSGDRILVQKYIYSFSRPQRWDVVVFKAPHQPDQNYIKRLVGLPNEAICIFDGNIYVSPLQPDGQPDPDGWRIARKTARPQAQRAVWQPIYHSQFIPRDGGRNRASQFAWSAPWMPPDEQRSLWEIDGQRSYRYSGAGRGEIRFDFVASGDNETIGIYPYNQLSSRIVGEPIEDIRLAAHFEPDQAGLRVSLSTTARLLSRPAPDFPEALADREPDTLTATLDEQGTLILTATPPGGPAQELGRAQAAPLAPGRATQVELWYVDQEASVWIDGKLVLVHAFDYPLEEIFARPAPQARPTVRIVVEGGPVTLHQVELDRDLYYSATDHGDNGDLLLGGAVRRPRGIEMEPALIGPNQYFFAGDNSPRSQDSRYWPAISMNAWILERFDGTPGLVPGELIMGKAFFVYFPAMLQLSEDKPGIIPNFGDIRFIH